MTGCSNAKGVPMSICSPILRTGPRSARRDFLGDRWSLLILRSALFGVRRYDDFHTEFGIRRPVLAYPFGGLSHGD